MAVKVLILTCVIFLLSNVCYSQERCGKAIAEAPAIAGLRIGKSFDDIKPLLSSITKVKPFKNGTGTIYLSYAEQNPPAVLSDIGTLWLRLFENKIYQVEAFYPVTAKNEKIDSFIEELSASYNISAATWQIKNNYATLDCGEFLIKADTVLNRHLEVTDKAVKAEFDKWRTAEKAKKKS